jgi:hypothetical protein
MASAGGAATGSRRRNGSVHAAPCRSARQLHVLRPVARVVACPPGQADPERVSFGWRCDGRLGINWVTLWPTSRLTYESD